MILQFAGYAGLLGLISDVNRLFLQELPKKGNMSAGKDLMPG